jgi:nitrate reductase NapAB chaperone NapD
MISGVVVASRPEHLGAVTDAVKAFAWAEVHFSDPAGRLVVTLEADGLDDSIARFGTLQKIPNVLSASLAEYRLEENEEMAPPRRETD